MSIEFRKKVKSVTFAHPVKGVSKKDRFRKLDLPESVEFAQTRMDREIEDKLTETRKPKDTGYPQNPVRRTRVKGRPLPKVVLSLRISPELAEKIKENGWGWQPRAEEALKKEFL